MDGPLTDLPSWAVWLAGGLLAAAVLAVVVLGWLTARTARALRRTSAAQDAAHAEIVRLREELEQRTGAQAAPATGRASQVTRAEFVITGIGEPATHPRSELARHAPADVERRVTDSRQFAAIALGESLARVAVLGHGLRRALSPEARNRAAFAARQEVRRSRKHRRQELREARRLLHEHQREHLTHEARRDRTGGGAA